jgi:hypothetical protein
MMLVLTLLFSWCSPAFAHPLVEEGRRLIDVADFDGARRAFDRAERATDLDRDALVRLFEGRALLFRALGDTASMEGDLARLASIDPSHAFTPQTPPDLVEAFARVRSRGPGPLRVEVEARSTPSGVAISARAIGDAGGIVREIQVFGRVAGSDWRRTSGQELVVQRVSEPVEFFARAIGPGGAVVASHGEVDAPLVHAASAPIVAGQPAVPTQPIASGEAEDDDAPIWPWLVGAGAAVAIAVTVVLVFVVRSDQTEPTFPHF